MTGPTAPTTLAGVAGAYYQLLDTGRTIHRRRRRQWAQARLAAALAAAAGIATTAALARQDADTAVISAAACADLLAGIASAWAHHHVTRHDQALDPHHLSRAYGTAVLAAGGPGQLPAATLTCPLQTARTLAHAHWDAHVTGDAAALGLAVASDFTGTLDDLIAAVHTWQGATGRATP